MRPTSVIRFFDWSEGLGGGEVGELFGYIVEVCGGGVEGRGDSGEVGHCVRR